MNISQTFFGKKHWWQLLAFVILNSLFILPQIIKNFQGSYYVGTFSYQYIFGTQNLQYPAFSTWRDYMGVTNVPSFIDIFFAWPIQILYFITGGTFLTWILYAIAIYSLAGGFAALYMKRLFTNMPLYFALLIGLFYTSFIPINIESTAFSIKIASALLPLALWLLLKLFDTFYIPKKFVLYLFLLIVVSANILICDARCFVSLIVIAFVQIIFFLKFKFEKQPFVYVACLAFWGIGTTILFLPFKYTLDILYKTSAQLSAPVSEAVINKYLKTSQFLTFAIPPYHMLSTPELFINILILVFIAIGTILFFAKRNKNNLYLFIIALSVIYFVLANNKLSELLTLHLPYGQMFRSWRVSTFIANILIILPLGIFVHLKNKILKAAMVLYILTYFAIALTATWPIYAYGDKDAIQQYKAANVELKRISGNSHAKVLWVPEMGGFNLTATSGVGPDWVVNDSLQGFPDLSSSMPTYTHYTNPMTHIYTWLSSAVWNSEIKTNPKIANLLNILGIEYLIIHDDISEYKNSVSIIKTNLENASNIQKVYSSGFITIYKNTAYQNRIWAIPSNNATWCDGGLNCLSKYYFEASPYKATTFLTDITLNNKFGKDLTQIYITNQSTSSDAYNNIIINSQLSDNNNSQILFAKDYFDILNKVSCLSDTHQGLHHPFYDTSEKYSFDNSFAFDNCFFVANSPNNKNHLSAELKKGEYKMLVRYLKSNRGGTIKLFSKYFDELISTKGQINEVNGFTYNVSTVEIPEDTRLDFTLVSGEDSTNLVNLVAFIPTQVYEENILQLEQLKSPEININHSINISDIQNIRPDKWTFSISTTSPSILNFAESYNQYWKLEIIDRVGDKYEFESLPGNGIINSFAIDTPIEGSATIYYGPQRIFIQKIIFSLMELIGIFILYIGIIKFLPNSRIIEQI